jgi:hypothetical protein
VQAVAGSVSRGGSVLVPVIAGEGEACSACLAFFRD